MIVTKKPTLVFFGLFLVGMLFVPPSMPFMVPEAEAHYMTPGSHTGSHTATGQLTIEDLIISEYIPPPHIGGEHKVQYIVAGYLPPYDTSVTITKEIIKPDGTMGATDHESFGVPPGEVWYQTVGYVLVPFNASGWTMKVCADFGDGQCVEQNFTIEFAYLVGAGPDDTTPPIITVPADQTFIITNSTGKVYNFQVTATDNLAIDTTGTSNAGPGIWCVDYVPHPTPPGTLFPVGTTNVVCSASDTAGNYAQSVFTVTVIFEAADTTPPVITAPSDQTFTTTDPAGYVYNFQVSATDDVAIDTTRTSNGGPGIWCIGVYDFSGVTRPAGPGTLFLVGSTLVVCSVGDTAGNNVQSAFTVTVVLEETADTTPPVVTVPSNLTFTIDSGNSAVFGDDITFDTDAITATDNVGVEYIPMINWNPNLPDDTAYCTNPDQGFYQLPASLVFTSESGPWLLGTSTVTCYADDAAGNQGTASFTVTVVLEGAADTTPPSQNYDVIASYDGGAWWQSDFFTPKLLTINTGDTVTWKRDPNSYTGYSRIYASFIGGYQSIGVPVGTDVVTYTHTFNQPGTYVYTDHVSSQCQNYNPDPTTCPIGTIVVADPTPTGDTTPPTVTVPSNISVSTPDNSGRTTTFSASASDNAGVSSGPTCSPSSGSQFPIGTTTVACFATDSAGNMGSGTFTVTVAYDSTLPTVGVYYTGGTWAQSDYFQPSTLTINVGETVTWLYNPNSQTGYHRIYGSFTGGYHYIGDNYVTYDHTFNQVGTYVYTDHTIGACQTYNPDPAVCPIGTINVVESGTPSIDDTMPVITASNLSFSITNSTGSLWYTMPTATDNVGVVSITCTPPSGSSFPIGITTVTCSATDYAGNEGTASFTVTIEGDDAAAEAAAAEAAAAIAALEAEQAAAAAAAAAEAAEEEIVIPSWIKSNAGWWDTGLIDDRNYVTGLQWLITNGVMTIG